MRRNYTFSLLLLPFSILSLLASVLLVQRAGISYQTTLSYGELKLLPQESVEVDRFFAEKPVESLVLYDANDPDTELLIKNILATLDSMRVKYDTYEIRSGQAIDLAKYRTVIVAFVALEDLEPQILSLVNWVEGGGRLLFSIRPVPSRTFSAIYRKLGIVSKDDQFTFSSGVEYKTDLLPGANGISLDSPDLKQTSYLVQLDEDVTVHLVSADEKKVPLLWEKDFGTGRFVFINSDLFGAKESRGIIGAAYSLLQDVFAYPVINGSVFFIDDFPSPIPAGSTEMIEKQYGMKIQDFYINVWWPDVLNISKKYGMKYTGVMIEIYDDNVSAPFDKQLDNERHRYFGSLVLANQGELGLHGYNHVPLCLSETGVNQFHEYPGWPTTESMQLSVYELIGFGKALFPDNEFTTYVPPSNILCSDARLWLPAVLPNLKVIAGVYINDADKTSYEQEFTESSDGIIELPRIISGYDPSNVSRYAAINELGLHYVNSHFVHPDDVLDPARGALQGWSYLSERFESYAKWLDESAPGLRDMTAREAAIAVQRYARLAVQTTNTQEGFEIDLGNFYDEAWLMLRSRSKPLSIEGGTITPVTSNLYLVKASDTKVVIHFEGGTP